MRQMTAFNLLNARWQYVIAFILRFSFLFLGDFHPEVDIDERIRRLQNDFGVDVLFTWGIIEQEGKNLSKNFFDQVGHEMMKPHTYASSEKAFFH